MSAAPRIVFMGTPAFAVPSLEACCRVGKVVTVLTQPDKPAGRGREVHAGPVKERAERARIPLLQPARLKGTDVAQRLRQLEPTVCVVAAYGKILPLEVLEAAPLGCVNVHASLLPRWRGAAPIQWAIAEGDQETGVTLMKLDVGLDTGPTFGEARTPISEEDTAQTLSQRLATLGAEVLEKALPEYLSGKRVPVPQPEKGVTLAPPLNKEQGELDFRLPAVVLARRVRAYTPWPGTFARAGGGLLKVLQASPLPGGGAAPGTLVGAGPGGLDVACGEGALRLLRVQPEGKRAMSIQEFLAGRRMALGDRPFQS